MTVLGALLTLARTPFLQAVVIIAASFAGFEPWRWQPAPPPAPPYVVIAVRNANKDQNRIEQAPDVRVQVRPQVKP